MLLASVMAAGTFTTTAFAYTGDAVQENTAVSTAAQETDAAESANAGKTDDAPLPMIMLLLFVIGAAGVGGYLYIKMRGIKPASKKNQPDPDADYHDEDEDALQLPEDDGDEDEEVDVNEDYEAESDDEPV